MTEFSSSKGRFSARETFTELFIYSNLSMTSLYSQFFDSKGFSSIQIGILMAVLPTFSLLANPFWFARSKAGKATLVLGTVTWVSSLLVWGVYFSPGFPLTFVSMVALAFFMASVVPLAESVVVPSLKSKGKSFDRVRLFGTLGFSLTALLAGLLVKFSFATIFALSSFALMTVGFLSGGFSGVKSRKSLEGGDSQIETGSGKLPRTFSIMVFGAVLSITIGAFGSTFFPVLAREAGFDASAAGLGFFLMGLSEVPFLFFADRLLVKFGYTRLLAFGLFLTGLRWFLTSLATTFVLFMALQLLHGLNYIVVYYSMTSFIHYKLSPNTRLKAQTIYWMSTMGLSYFLGSVGGGVLVYAFGLRRVYLSLGAAGMLLAVLFAILFRTLRSRVEPRS